MAKHKEEICGEWYLWGTVLMHSLWPLGANLGAKQMPQLEFLAYITLIGGVFFFFTTAYYKQFSQLGSLKNLFWMSLYTLFIGIIPYCVITYATRYTTAIDTAILTQTEAVFGAIAGYFFFKESLSKHRLLGVLCLLSGSLALLYRGGLQFNLANLAIALAPISFVAGNIIAKQIQKNGVGWSPLLFFRSLAGGLLTLLIASQVEPLSVPPSSLWGLLLFMGLFIFGLEKLFWQLALARMDISKASALIVTSPIFSFFLAFIFLKEQIDSYQWAALFLTLLGIVFITKTHSKQWEA